MTGLDFSAASLDEARRVAQVAGADVDFVQADVMRRRDGARAGTFDLVYTGIGALCWLPDIRRVGHVVAAPPGAGRAAVRPGGPSGAVGPGLRARRRPARPRVPVPGDGRAGGRQLGGQLRRGRGGACGTWRATRGTTDSGRSCRPCSTRAWCSRSSSSTRASRGTPCPRACCGWATAASGASSTGPSGCRSPTPCRPASHSRLSRLTTAGGPPEPDRSRPARLSTTSARRLVDCGDVRDRDDHAAGREGGATPPSASPRGRGSRAGSSPSPAAAVRYGLRMRLAVRDVVAGHDEVEGGLSEVVVDLSAARRR